MKGFAKKVCLFGLFVVLLVSKGQLVYATLTKATSAPEMKLSDIADIGSICTPEEVQQGRDITIGNQQDNITEQASKQLVHATIGDLYHIYFPKDAKQPTTEEAVKYSCANADNKMTDDGRLNSPITDWYMKMFGVIPIQDGGEEYVTAGFAHFPDPQVLKKALTEYSVEYVDFDQDELRNHPEKIRYYIGQLREACREGAKKAVNTFEDDASTKLGVKKLLPGQKIKSNTEDSMQKLAEAYINKIPLTTVVPTRIMYFSSAPNGFIESFKKIASTPVGRVLLYRLLIEIRRQKDGDGSQGADILNKLKGMNITPRNKARSLEILEGKNTFDDKKFSITFQNTDSTLTTVQRKNQVKDSYYKVMLQNRRADIGLFHEMVHWFHYLRDKIRCSNEDTSLSNKIGQLSSRSLGIVYYGNTVFEGSLDGKGQKEREKVSSETWQRSTAESFLKDKKLITYEEMRTIIGVPNNTTIHPEYREGDDISENLYRINVDHPIRFGHDNEEYAEDAIVINRVVKTLNKNIEAYNLGKQVTFGDKKENLNFDLDTAAKEGLGNCRRKQVVR